MFSSEYCKIFKNSLFIEHPWWLLLEVADQNPIKLASHHGDNVLCPSSSPEVNMMRTIKGSSSNLYRWRWVGRWILKSFNIHRPGSSPNQWAFFSVRKDLNINLICLPGGRGKIVPPRRFFDRCILTGRALKLILHDFSSNFILNMWPVKLFLIIWIICPHRLVSRWPSTIVAYYGVVDSLLHRLSFRNWM